MRFSNKVHPDPTLATLRQELSAAQGELSQAYRQFNEAVDPELVESSIYQMSAVKAPAPVPIVPPAAPQALE